MHSPQKTILSLFVLLNCKTPAFHVSQPCRWTSHITNILSSIVSLPVLSAGTKFITEACASDAECAGNCCGFNSGKCSGAVVALQRDGGCGFGDAAPNDNAAQALGFTGGITSPSTGSAVAGAAAAPAVAVASAAVSAAPVQNVAAADTQAVAPGTQFITGACTSDADCAAGCCGFNSGKCAGPVVAQERDGGCGFGDAQPNDNAAQQLRGQRRGMAWQRHM